jgi:hypothetical protein
MPPGGRDAVNECELEAYGREGLDKKKTKASLYPRQLADATPPVGRHPT